LPWTHRSYSLLDEWKSPEFEDVSNEFIGWGMIDAVFAMTVLALILFLQIPRRKEAAKVE